MFKENIFHGDRSFMKAIASNTSRYTFTQLCQRLSLGRILGDAYGTGAMTADYKRKAVTPGWTTEQLLALSKAKSLYH